MLLFGTIVHKYLQLTGVKTSTIISASFKFVAVEFLSQFGVLLLKIGRCYEAEIYAANSP